MPLKPRVATPSEIYPVAERHYQVRKAILALLVLEIRDSTDRLRLIAFLACGKPWNLILPLAFSCLKYLRLYANLVKSPRTYASKIIKEPLRDPVV